MWHDFCPPIYDKFPATRGVMEAVHDCSFLALGVDSFFCHFGYRRH